LIPTGVRLLFICRRYFYAGQVEYANQQEIRLHDAELVLDTGPMTAPYWNEADWIDTIAIPRAEIESWMVCDKRIKPDETKNDLRRTDMSVIGKNKRVQSYALSYDWAPAGGWGG
jgi:hypothetical protein